MEKVDFLPLGSVVILRGGVKKTMIIARGLAAKVNNDTKYFDYGGCLYPEGLAGDQILYFNNDSIMKIVHKGFSDEDDALMVSNINEWVEKSQFERGDPYELNKGQTKDTSGAGQEG